jgi:putative addiction module component (TIGR02574 family)
VIDPKGTAMPKTLEAITHEVLELPHNQRLALARIILDLDAGPADPGVEAAWDEEIRARLKAYDEGRLEAIPWEDVQQEMQDRIKK